MESTDTTGAWEADPSSRYVELDHPADLFLQIWGPDLPGLFENALFALYDHLAVLDGFEHNEHLTIESAEASLAETLRSLLSEALYRFSTEGFVAVKAEVTVDAQPNGESRATARLTGERVHKTRHRLLTEIKAVTYHQLSVEPAPDGGWRATVLLDV